MSPLRSWPIPLVLLFFALFTATAACTIEPNAVAPEHPAPAPASAKTPAPATMKAVRVHAFGGIDALQYEDVPRPRPGQGELLVRVHAAGVNPVDVAIRTGKRQDWLHHTLPLTLGWDVSGVVEEVGSGVTRFKPGDAVYSCLDVHRNGAYAEWVIVQEREAAFKPTSIDHVKAAAVPIGALTAWQGLIEHAGLKPGQTVLIHGASGGVGTMAVQIAKTRGARVIATGSARNLDYLKALGADEVIDYQAKRFEEVVKDIDVVFDTVGEDTQERSWKVLKKGGILVSIRSEPSQEKAQALGVRAVYFHAQPNAEQLADLGRLIDAGRIQVTVSEVIPLKDVARAHAQVETRHTRGKVVLRVAE
jgi:NADPH:quinone reductase-like Zn-dependent oxidoreductase